MASYPKLAADDAAGEHYEDQNEKGNAYVPTCSLKLILSILFLHAQLQQQLHGVLQAGFDETRKGNFSAILQLSMT